MRPVDKWLPRSAPAEGAWVSTVFRLVLGVVLLIAGGLKIGDLEQSGRAVKAYQLFPPDIADLIGYALPPAEIVLGVMLILGLWVRWAAVAVAALMVAFIAGIISVWARGLSIDCGCFSAGGAVDGPINQFEYLREIVRDVVLLGMAIWLVRFPHSRWSLDVHARPHLHRHHQDESPLPDGDMIDDDDLNAEARSLADDPAADAATHSAAEPAQQEVPRG